MQNRVVEISSDGIHLSLKRGFLKLSCGSDIVGEVALPDIGSVIVRGYGASISLNLVASLAERNIPVVLCGTNQLPSSIVWPVSGHHAQSAIIEAQSGLSLPRKKQIWKEIIQSKIRAQAQVLQAFKDPADDLSAMADRVKSGDVENLVAQASRKYWTRMMGRLEERFRRSRTDDGVNAALNYGYTVLRAAAARSILSAGLHPAFSVHHVSRGEAFRLADDLMEPFRPLVDLTVRRIFEARSPEAVTDDLSIADKNKLVEVLSLDLIGPYGASPVQTCLDRLCQSLANICLGTARKPELPSGLVFKASIEEGAN